MSNLISAVISIGLAALVYVFLLLILKVMDKNDIMLLPGGGKIYSLLTKLKLYK